MKSRVAQIEDELKTIGYSSDQLQKMKEVEDKYNLNQLALPTIKEIKKRLWKIYLAKIHAAELIKSEVDDLTNYINVYDTFIK